MSPSPDVYSRFKEPSNFDSDSVDDVRRFPAKHADGTTHYTSTAGRSQHYTDSEPASRSRFASLSRSRTPTSAKRSRKTSSSTARNLVRALLHERLETDATSEAQLARAYDIIREESRRAAEAERMALETAERLKGLAISRAHAQKDATKAQAELRAYKIQLENAQRQLQDANAIVAESDAERMRAEEAARRLKRALEKYRLSEEVRRAREIGIREGLQESYYGIPPPPSRSSLRAPLLEDDDEDFPQTPTSNVPLPVPPPASMPVVSRPFANVAAPLGRTRTPMSVTRGWQGGIQTPVPEVIRQQATPPTRRAQTPALPTYPPEQVPILSHRTESPDLTPVQPVYDDYGPGLGQRDMHINPVPDHIIIRSPEPRRLHAPGSPPGSRVLDSVLPARPPSSQASQRIHHPYSSQDPRVHRHATHHSLNDPARQASESASRIYEHYSTSSESSNSEVPVRPASRVLRRRDDFPQQETIIPRPSSGAGHRQRLSPPVRPPSAADSIPVSAAELARRQRQGLRRASTSSSSSASVNAFPTPSSFARLQRLPLGDRSHSAESSSSVPGITIEPPSRPESIDSPPQATPFIGSDPSLPGGLPNNVHIPASPRDWGIPQPGAPQSYQTRQEMAPARSASRTGFMYGPGAAGPQHGPMSAGGGTGFSSIPSLSAVPAPSINFGGPDGGVGEVIPPRPQSTDYFTADHHRAPDQPYIQSQSRRRMHGHGHRREPARMGMGAGDSVDSLPKIPGGLGGRHMIDPNAFHDPDTDPSLSSSSDTEVDEFRPRPGPSRERHRGSSPTPRATTPRATTFALDERRSSFASPGVSVRNGRSTPGPPLPPKGGEYGGGYVPPRPMSSSDSVQAIEDLSSSYGPHPASHPHAVGSRNRKGSIAAGGVSRTAYGNTPFIRSSGLYDD